MPQWYVKGVGVVRLGTEELDAIVPARCSTRKPKSAFIWPHGGRRRSAMGRLTDILTCKGPDTVENHSNTDILLAVYVGTNYNRTPGAVDGPSKGRWTGWKDAVDDCLTTVLDRNNHLGTLDFAGTRSRDKCYDFRTRKYRRACAGTWMDATYGLSGSDDMPSAIRAYPGGHAIVMHPHGRTVYTDPRNFGSHYTAGYRGQGGYWHPAIGAVEYWDELQATPVHH